MNCLEFRRLKLADPRHLTSVALSHMSGCATCQTFSLEVGEIDEHLATTLDVPVPDGLAERIILGRKTGERLAGIGGLSPRLWALAATILLTVGVMVNWSQDYTSQDYAMLAIKHVLHEPEAFTKTRDVDPAYLRTVMHNFGATLEAPLGRVRYMTLCPVAGGTGWHIVFETEQGGLATLILVPTQHMNVPLAQATMKGWTAIARPGGQGYYAIITDSAESLKKVDELVKSRIRWNS